LGFLFFPVLANAKENKTETPPSGDAKLRIAIFPVENLSGTVAPLKEIRQALIKKLSKQGFQVLGEENLEKFMAKHRIRYVGGLDSGTARAFKEEMGIEGVLITSLEFYSETDPPKVALTARLISTGEAPSILWMDGIGLAGDDSPGILGLGLIEDPKALLEKVMNFVTDSLMSYLLTGRDEGQGRGAKRKFRPKVVYRSPELEPERKYVVAVLPFFNRSERKYAGEILVLHFLRQLRKFDNFDVIEPGILRQELLDLRVIMEDGVSLANADAVFSILNADLIISGKVIEYQDYQGLWGKPKVDFSAVLIERKSRGVVWGSNSYNEGDDGVFFFDRGRVNTAYAMTTQMVRWIGEWVLGNKDEK
jgi:TolB-like protein